MFEERHSDFFTLSEDIKGWIAQDSSIMLKAVTKFGDPVELSSEEARSLADTLMQLVTRLEGPDPGDRYRPF